MNVCHPVTFSFVGFSTRLIINIKKQNYPYSQLTIMNFLMRIKKHRIFTVVFFVILLTFLIYLRYFSSSDYNKNISPDKVQVCGPSLVRCGDFENEDAFNYWNINADEKNRRILDGIGYKGTKGFVLILGQNCQLSFLSQKLDYETTPEALLVEAWVKTVDMGELSRALVSICCINPEINYNWKGQEIYGQLAVAHSKKFSGTTPWNKIKFALMIPDKTTEISITIEAAGPIGKAYFDEIKVCPAEKI